MKTDSKRLAILTVCGVLWMGVMRAHLYTQSWPEDSCLPIYGETSLGQWKYTSSAWIQYHPSPTWTIYHYHPQMIILEYPFQICQFTLLAKSSNHNPQCSLMQILCLKIKVILQIMLSRHFKTLSESEFVTNFPKIPTVRGENNLPDLFNGACSKILEKWISY